MLLPAVWLLNPVLTLSQQHQFITPLDLVVWNKQKREVIADHLPISQAEAGKFWKIYEAYDYSRQSLCDQRINLLNLEAEQSSPESRKNMIEQRLLANELAFQQMFEAYYKAFKGIITPSRATYLIVVEKYFQSVLNHKLDSLASAPPESLAASRGRLTDR